MPCIVHFSGTHTSKVYWLSRDKELIVGRAPENDVFIEDQNVSKRHARFVVSPEGAVLVEDMDSTNGTYVNGDKVTRRALRDGDRVLIPPSYVLKFSYQVNLAPQMNLAPEATGGSGTGAALDTLTGVYARQYMLGRIDEDFIRARKQGEDLALLLIAVDGFEMVNKTYGQDTGNMVLREVAKVVGSVLAQEAVLARYENDTFATLLRNLSDAQTVVLAQRIRRAVKNRSFARKGRKIPVTISIGVGGLTRNMKNAMDLIREVQAHLDKAKSAGHDTINGCQSIRAIFSQIRNKHVA